MSTELDLDYEFDSPHKYAAVVHLHRPVPRLGDLLEPRHIVEFDWVPDKVEVILIASTHQYELERLAQNIAHQQMEQPLDAEDEDKYARQWWAARPGPEASAMTFMEWRDACPRRVWRVEVVPTTAYTKKED